MYEEFDQKCPQISDLLLQLRVEGNVLVIRTFEF